MSIEKMKAYVLDQNDEGLKDFFQKVIKQVESDVERLSEDRGRTFKSAVSLYVSELSSSIDAVNLLANVDHKCDCAWRALSAQIQASLMHFNDDVVATATQVNNAIEKFGDPTELEYDDEYRIICKALLTLESIDASTLKTAKVDDYVANLRKCYNDFNKAQEDERARFASLQFAAVKAARTTAIKAWNKYVDSLAVNAESNAKAAKTISVIDSIIG